MLAEPRENAVILFSRHIDLYIIESRHACLFHAAKQVDAVFRSPPARACAIIASFTLRRFFSCR